MQLGRKNRILARLKIREHHTAFAADGSLLLTIGSNYSNLHVLQRPLFGERRDGKEVSTLTWFRSGQYRSKSIQASASLEGPHIKKARFAFPFPKDTI